MTKDELARLVAARVHAARLEAHLCGASSRARAAERRRRVVELYEGVSPADVAGWERASESYIRTLRRGAGLDSTTGRAIEGVA